MRSPGVSLAKPSYQRFQTFLVFITYHGKFQS